MHKISITIGTLFKAGRLCQHFNMAAQNAYAKEKVVVVLKTAVDMMTGDMVSKLKQGYSLCEGSGWHGPDEVLSEKIAQDIAKNTHASFLQLEDTAEYGLKDRRIGIDIDDKTKRGLTEIKKAFMLSSDFEAARLAVSAYDNMKHAAYRGAGHHYMENPNNLSSKSLDFNYDFTKQI